MDKFTAITNAMNRKELEIARMTAYIAKVGEDKVGADYLRLYNDELRIWDEMKASRDALK